MEYPLASDTILILHVSVAGGNQQTEHSTAWWAIVMGMERKAQIVGTD